MCDSTSISIDSTSIKKKQDYKGGTNDKTHDSPTLETGVSRSDDAILARTLDTGNKNLEMMNKITIRQ